MEYSVTNNQELQQFEIEISGLVSFITYELFADGIRFIHESVPSKLRGKGIATALTKYVLDDALKNHLKVKPDCPFVKSYIDKHVKYQANSLSHS